eukprot:TRINITY_DN56583_c0_g1_i1.p1 TRINITY_DN56583_c0_g1~~TRINITY_DN56583_c0_g1_i1.p1  ORF type:complete len:101 (-),score=16.13 TRINITY_DN56583_c0_g1_i1:45-347(-)
MLRSLVGSEMCIRDRDKGAGTCETARRKYRTRCTCPQGCTTVPRSSVPPADQCLPGSRGSPYPSADWCHPRSLTSKSCLLYTSDAADEEDSGDLGGRRII